MEGADRHQGLKAELIQHLGVIRLLTSGESVVLLVLLFSTSCSVARVLFDANLAPSPRKDSSLEDQLHFQFMPAHYAFSSLTCSSLFSWACRIPSSSKPATKKGISKSHSAQILVPLPLPSPTICSHLFTGRSQPCFHPL